MKNLLRSVFFLTGLVLGSLAVTSAHATTISGQYWQNGTTGAVPVAGSSVYSSTPSATFTLSGQSNLLDLTTSNYTLGGFLSSGGDTVTFSSGNGLASHSINDGLFQFTGTTYIAAGSTIALTHDDGIILYLNGTSVLNSANPTGAINSSYTVGASGIYNFNLDYAEVGGAPAELVDATGALSAPTPEPGSIALLGTGLLAGAGLIRRRIAL